MVRITSFDVGETLMDYNYLNYVWNNVIPGLYARKRSLRYEKAKELVLREYAQVGSDDIRWYLPHYWFERFKLKEEPLEIFRLHTDKIRFYPEVESVLNSLSKKYDLIIASGIPTNLVEIIIQNFRNCFRHIFSPVTDLHQVRKTQEFYKMISSTLATKPSNIVHVGDDYLYDYVIPRQTGITSILLDRKEEKQGKYVISDLEKLPEKVAYIGHTLT